MSSTSEDDSAALDQSDFLTEATIENLKGLREGMVQNYKGFLKKSREFELADVRKYSILSNIKETTNFENDSEDMGVEEDLVFLNIK